MARGRGAQPTEIAELPSNIEAEQAVLGILLYWGQEAILRLPEWLEPTHFIEPFHQRLFATAQKRLRNGQGADPVVVGDAFATDPAFVELGGTSYLANLVEHAPPVQGLPDYAEAIAAMYVRREIVLVADEAKAAAMRNFEEDAEAILNQVTVALTEIRVGSSAEGFVDSDIAVDRVLDRLDNPGSYDGGILTGLEPVDDQLGPWLPGDLIVGGGRTGMGKSAWAGVVGTNVARQGAGVAEFHAEMGVDQVWRRRLSAEAFGIFAGRAPAYSKIRKRTVEYDERQMLERAKNDLRGIPIRSLKRSGITLQRMRTLLLKQRAEWERQNIPLGLVIVDHAGLVRPDKEYRSRVDEQRAVSNGLKEMADDLKVPVLALVQLSRKVEERPDKKPLMSDLKDSGSWEEDADVIALFFRAAYYARFEKEPLQRTPKEQADWADWDQRHRSPWIDVLIPKVREGEPKDVKVWANMKTNTVLGSAPTDDFGGFI